MNSSSLSSKTLSVQAGSKPHLFLFLEIFEREGGIQSYVQDIVRSYLELKHQTADVFLLRDGKNCGNRFASNSLRFHYFKNQSPQLGRLQFASALLLYLIRQQPQHVFCGHINLAPMVSFFCKGFGIPYTVLTYGKEVWQPLSPQFRQALQQADQIWTISRYSQCQACEANQLDPNKMRLLSCAIDGEAFTPGAKSPELLKKYGLQDAKVLLTVARLWSGDIYKGVDVTIRALPQIAEAVPNVKYLVIGRGDDQPRLASLAEELGVADRVVFAGFVPIADLVEHYRIADAYVMPSQEGFGIVYLEAMACGVPVLSGDADGSADPLQDGLLGWQVPHRDADAVAEACITMLQEVAKREQHQPYDQRCNGRWLRQQAINLFGKAAFAQQFQSLITQC